MEQARDFQEESDALHALIAPLPAGDYRRATQFKGWSINDILQHLHFFNRMADFSLTEPDRFAAEYGEMKRRMDGGETMIAVTDDMLDGLRGPALLDAWHSYYTPMAARFAAADPRQRLKWAGPDMSARSSITARLMETWAHAQEVYDLLGVRRVHADRIRNIAHLGWNTYGWTFVNRGQTPPVPQPFLRLEAPSGAVWEWGEASVTDRIDGLAEEFCQVVVQTRNIADTSLRVTGASATSWMAIAQCFAGPPMDPPAPGTRGPVESES